MTANDAAAVEFISCQRLRLRSAVPPLPDGSADSRSETQPRSRSLQLQWLGYLPPQPLPRSFLPSRRCIGGMPPQAATAGCLLPARCALCDIGASAAIQDVAKKVRRLSWLAVWSWVRASGVTLPTYAAPLHV